LEPDGLEVFVSQAEVAASLEFVSGQGGGMYRFQDGMFPGVDQRFFGPGEVAPQEKDQVLLPVRKCPDHGIGEPLPADPTVGPGLAMFYGQHSVQEEYPLTGPMGQIAMPGMAKGEIALKFLVDIDQGCRDPDAFRDGEAETHGLARLMIGILSEDDHLDLVKWGRIKGIEDQGTGRVDCFAVLPGLDQELPDLAKVGKFEFGCQGLLPTCFDAYINFRHGSSSY